MKNRLSEAMIAGISPRKFYNVSELTIHLFSYAKDKKMQLWKLTGSKVKPFTLFPVVNTTIVALPYKAYPDAT